MLYPISKHTETLSQTVIYQLIMVNTFFYEEYVPGTQYCRKIRFCSYIEVYMRLKDHDVLNIHL